MYLVSDDRPVQRREFYAAIAERVGAPEPRFAGNSGDLGKRCCNRKVRNELGLNMRFPTVQEGLIDALHES